MWGMDALPRAIKHFGSQQKMAEALGIRQSTVSEWLIRRRPIPPLRCIEIERATGVRRWELRPSDWFLYWPELRKAKGAPKPETV